jgi:hypothetical protein
MEAEGIVDTVTKHIYGPNPEPYSIKVEKGQKGGYAWEISVKGGDINAILSQIIEIDLKLKAQYGGGA